MKSSSAEQATPAPLARCPWCGEKDAEIRRLKQELAARAQVRLGEGGQERLQAIGVPLPGKPGKAITGRQGMDGVIHGAWCQCIACRAAVE